MGTINIYNSTGSNKNSLEFNGNTDSSVNTEHLTGLASNVQSQIDSLDISKATIYKSGTQPSGTSTGDLWFDTSLNVLSVYSGTEWIKLTNKAEATGGTKTSVNGFYVHTFLSSDTFEVTGGSLLCDILLVAGGAAGGTDIGGGGGAGGMLEYTGMEVSSGSYSVVVGAGGARNSSGQSVQYNSIQDGGDTSISGIASITTAIGGGGGGTEVSSSPGVGSGGSGGGQGPRTSVGSGTAGQGNNGGTSPGAVNQHPAGGGGGKASAGGNASGANGGNGGTGKQNNYDGNNYYYAAGGGGAAYSGGSVGGNGGIGGGGGGGAESAGSGGGSARNAGGNGTNGALYAVGGNGGTNTGSGGGGGGEGGTAGNGGSGIVIIRYPI